MTATPPQTKNLYLNGIYIGDVPATGDNRKDAEVAHAYIKNKGLGREVTLVQRMFGQACSFANTAAYLYRNDLARAPRNGLSMAPFVVNMAFSIEVYLKTLGQIHGATLRGHELLKLFDALPVGAQPAIGGATRKVAEHSSEKYPAVRDCIAELNGAFVEWRYLYEKPDSNEVKIQHAIFVGGVLHEACVVSDQV
ncbi:hypothetical protein [Paraburkholderia solisilvae]|uniref:HEPN domain-containing protein n=1 Tax=Paraburkholderia solisilvae TaxID=624376 RepID=A0A6J5DHQ1_9BURK|nr:hypothetical protein [Paraburkholderia solisilvae]CAB3752987.1 hypothetical protein LMG29739_01636 [Paraburkholderia solisilvae]